MGQIWLVTDKYIFDHGLAKACQKMFKLDGDNICGHYLLHLSCSYNTMQHQCECLRGCHDATVTVRVHLVHMTNADLAAGAHQHSDQLDL